MIETPLLASSVDASRAPSLPATLVAGASPATVHLGIDVSKKKLDVALLRLGKIRPKEVPNTAGGFEQLRAWLVAQDVKVSELHICMEATGSYSEACALWLSGHGYRVSIVNPLRIKGYGQSELSRNKTDPADAALIARFCAAHHPAVWQAPSLDVRVLRGWVERLAQLQGSRQQMLNRLEATSSELSALVKICKADVRQLDKAIEQQERVIKQHTAKCEQLAAQAALLESIPGMGHVTATKVLAYGGDISRFASAGAFAAFIGVTPQQRSSGTVAGRTRMAKRGLAVLRSALFMPALVSKGHNPVVMAMAERLSTKGLAPKAIVGAAMHKLARLIYGVLKSGKPFDANWAHKQGTPGAVQMVAAATVA